MLKSRTFAGFSLLTLLALSGQALGAQVALTPLVSNGVDAKKVMNVFQLMSSELEFMTDVDVLNEVNPPPRSLNTACLSNNSCLRGIATTNDSDAVLTGVITDQGSSYVLDLVYYADGRTQRRKAFTVSSDVTSLANAMTDILNEMLTGTTPAAQEAQVATSNDFNDALDDEDDFFTEPPAPPAGGYANDGLVDAPPTAEEIAYQRSQQEARARAAAEAQQRAQAEAQRRAQAEAQARAQAEARRQAEEEARRRAEEEARRRSAAEAQRRAQEEAQRRAAAEAQRKAQEEAQRRAAAEAQRKAQEEAQRRAAVEAQRRAQEEAQRRAAAEAQRRAQEEARRRADEQARQQTAARAQQQANQEAQQRAAAEAQRRAAAEAQRRAAAEAQRRAAEDALRRQEAAAQQPQPQAPQTISFASSVDNITAEDIDAMIQFGAPTDASSAPPTPQPTYEATYTPPPQPAYTPPPQPAYTPPSSQDSTYTPTQPAYGAQPGYTAPSTYDPNLALEEEELNSAAIVDLDEDTGKKKKNVSTGSRAVFERANPKIAQLWVRGGYSSYYTFGFITGGAELGVALGKSLMLIGGFDTYSVNRGDTWNTIYPGNVGMIFKIKTGTIAVPYIGADGIFVQYYADEQGQDWAGGARVRGGVDIMVHDNFGLNINLAVGAWTGQNWTFIEPTVKQTGLLPQANAGFVFAL